MVAPCIRIAGLGKRYRLSHQHRVDSLKGWLTSLAFRRLDSFGPDSDYEEFWALRNVSIEVEPGQFLALIGRNGSGKSTLLKILSRIIPPSEGSIQIQGRTASLLEVGTGFHPELTGRENIFLNGTMLGCPIAVVRSRFDSIVEFSGIERFIDTPVKHYSSGMYVRLAYAIAAHVDAEILVIDEVLAVGDAEFQEKCLKHVEALVSNGRTCILVSHALEQIRRMATHVAWMEQGKLREFSQSVSGVLDRYSESCRLT